MNQPILIGAVAYDPKVVPIWEEMREYFRETGPEIDYVLYSNYDRLVQALLAKHVDMGWNTNLAWLKLCRKTNHTCRALAMRDADARFTSVFVARSDSGVSSLADLKGKRIALGSADSAQAAILPIHFLEEAGIDPAKDCTLIRYNVDVGKHGDTGTSELEVLQALKEGKADAGVLGETTWAAQTTSGAIDGTQIKSVCSSQGYCHCNFTVLADFPQDVADRWTQSLCAMDYNHPRWQKLMDLEGLKQWIPADPEVMKGYEVLALAVERQGLQKSW